MDWDSRLTQSDQSLNAPALNYEEDSGEMIDFVANEEESHELVLAASQDLDYRKTLLFKAMENLNERERDIITQRRMSEPAVTLEDLSQKYDISRERVRQIENRAMEKLQVAIVEQ
jgi:RNA polymerase sigma-32 factor